MKGGKCGFLGQHCLDVPTSIKKPCAHGEHWRTHDSRNFVRRNPLQLVKYEDDAFLVREAIQQSPKSTHALTPLDVFVWGDIQASGRRVRRRFLGEYGAAPSRTSMHEDDVDRDAVQPRAEFRLSPEILQAAVDLNEHLLNDILEIAPLTDHAIHETRDVTAVTLVYLPERDGVAAGRARDEPLFVGHPPHLTHRAMLEARNGAELLKLRGGGAHT